MILKLKKLYFGLLNEYIKTIDMDENYTELAQEDEVSSRPKIIHSKCLVNGKWQYRRYMEKPCLHCGKIFLARMYGQKVADYCSHSCATIHKQKGVPKPSLYRRKHVQCKMCGRIFEVMQSSKRKFCSQSCATKWRTRQPEFLDKCRSEEVRAKHRESTRKQMQNVELRAKYSERMKVNNPMYNEETRKKMIASSKGKTIKNRGGNGHFTHSQITLQNAMKAEGLQTQMEYIVKTASIKGLIERLAYCYKIDVALPDQMIAIEVDGESHKGRKQKLLDAKKNHALNLLGWTVLRFSNKAIMDEMEEVLAKIHLCMISK